MRDQRHLSKASLNVLGVKNWSLDERWVRLLRDREESKEKAVEVLSLKFNLINTSLVDLNAHD